MSFSSLTGHFIIAMPTLIDSYFDQSVTYICEHDENGAFGIVINHETDITLQEFMSESSFHRSNSTSQNQHIFIGGPVQQDRGFILHLSDTENKAKWESTLNISNNISLTTSNDILQSILNNEGPSKNIIAIGYAGWGPGQLEQEFLNNAWLSCPANEDIIFNTPVKDRFQAAADIIGVNMNTISNDAGHA